MHGVLFFITKSHKELLPETNFLQIKNFMNKKKKEKV